MLQNGEEGSSKQSQTDVFWLVTMAVEGLSPRRIVADWDSYGFD